MTTNPASDLKRRWQSVRDRVDAACRAVDRDPTEVTILPASKTFAAADIREATALGLVRFGENRVQEVREKSPELADLPIQWVLIGHVQTNKARDVARLASEVQSLDRLDLAHALDRRLQHEGRSIEVLVQVKTSSEPSKSGLAPDALLPLLQQLRTLDTLQVRGLMTMAVHSDDAVAVRTCFRHLREWRERAVAEGFALPRLSMGMSGDFELAITEGATEVRIGSAIFGTRG